MGASGLWLNPMSTRVKLADSDWAQHPTDTHTFQVNADSLMTAFEARTGNAKAACTSLVFLQHRLQGQAKVSGTRLARTMNRRRRRLLEVLPRRQRLLRRHRPTRIPVLHVWVDLHELHRKLAYRLVKDPRGHSGILEEH